MSTKAYVHDAACDRARTGYCKCKFDEAVRVDIDGEELRLLREVERAAREAERHVDEQCHCDRGYPGSCGCNRVVSYLLGDALTALDEHRRGSK